MRRVVPQFLERCGVSPVQDAASQLIRKGNRASDANSRMQIARESVKVSESITYVTQNHVVHVYLRARPAVR